MASTPQSISVAGRSGAQSAQGSSQSPPSRSTQQNNSFTPHRSIVWTLRLNKGTPDGTAIESESFLMEFEPGSDGATCRRWIMRLTLRSHRTAARGYQWEDIFHLYPEDRREQVLSKLHDQPGNLYDRYRVSGNLERLDQIAFKSTCAGLMIQHHYNGETITNIKPRSRSKWERSEDVFAFTSHHRISDALSAAEERTLEIVATLHLDDTATIARMAASEEQTKRYEQAIKQADEVSAGIIQKLRSQVTAAERARAAAEAIAVASESRRRAEAAGYSSEIGRIWETLRALRSSSHPFDVCFKFEAEGVDVWESSSFLSSKSGYFKDLFESGFAETTKELREPEGGCNQPTHLVRINDESSQIFQAIFTWLRTGQIQLDSFGTGRGTSTGHDSQNGAASTASIYLLAHYLQLSQLVEITLDRVGNYLTPANVVVELARDWTGKPTEMKDKLLAYAVANWNEVKKSENLAPMLAEVAETPERGAAFLELMRLVIDR